MREKHTGRLFDSSLSQNKVYVIAEIGINHNGQIKEAKKLIRQAVWTGADAIKLQVRDLKSIYTKSVLEDSKKAEQSSQYLLNELRKAALTFEEIESLFKYTRSFQVDFMATPFDPVSAQFLEKLGVEIFKIGSPDFTNMLLMEQLVSLGKPLVISTGMSTQEEMERVVSYLKQQQIKFVLLHCNSTYPAFPQDINLRVMTWIRERFSVPVGYSGHERGYIPTLAAVSMGASIIERHITTDNFQEGPDHNASLTIKEFRLMVEAIREIEMALGSDVKQLNQGEKNNRLALAKSLVYGSKLKSGSVIQKSNLKAKTPARGIAPLHYPDFTGKKLLVDVSEDQYVSYEHISELNGGDDLDLSNLGRWGLIGRLNDFDSFLHLKPKIMEIHLTWRDLTGKMEKLFGPYPQELVIHTPEYHQDKLVDFTSPDDSIVNLSIEVLQKSINLAREISNQFRSSGNGGPVIVVHPGGHFEKIPARLNKDRLYRRLRENLKRVDSKGVNLLVENMPPLPWYFGGQWYNTVFMSAGEIAAFAQSTGWGVCYDTSHAKLYCNYAKIDFLEHAKLVAPYVKYLHISDAKGFAEEGLQIGEGDIEFSDFLGIYRDRDVGFVPEIWQGHIENGQGFKEALKRLETIRQRLA